jgi:SAM-dependent methyltransferase
MPKKQIKTILILSGRSPHASATLKHYLTAFTDYHVHIIMETPPFWAKFWKFARNRYKRFGLLSVLDAFSFVAVQRLFEAARGIKRPGANYFEVSDINNERCVREITRLAPDIVILNICSLVSEKTISQIDCEMINVHNGITPRYRGAGNIWALAEDNPDLIGVTLHYVDAGIDTGKIISQRLLDPVKNHMRFDDIDREAFLAGARMAVAYVSGSPAAIKPDRRPLLDRFYPAAGLSTWLRARLRYRRRLLLGLNGNEYDQAWHEQFEKLSTTDGLSDAQRLMWQDDSTVAPRDKQVLELLNKYRRSNWNILDLGCGDGRYAKYIGSGYVGCDYSEGAMSLGENNPGTFVLAPADRLPFDDGSFDATIAVGLLQHLYSAQKVIDEMVRVTSIGGIIIINTLRMPFAIELAGFALLRPSLGNIKLALAVFLRRFSSSSGVAKRYRAKEIVQMLGARGHMVTTRYDGVLGTRFLARELSVVCRRTATRRDLERVGLTSASGR